MSIENDEFEKLTEIAKNAIIDVYNSGWVDKEEVVIALKEIKETIETMLEDMKD